MARLYEAQDILRAVVTEMACELLEEQKQIQEPHFGSVCPA